MCILFWRWVVGAGGGEAGSEVAWRGWVQVATSRCVALFSANKGIATGPAPRHAGRPAAGSVSITE